MIDLTKLPNVGNFGLSADVLYRETMAMCVRDGRAARACGLLRSECPPFVDPDMAISWDNGWRWEDKERKQP